MNKHHITPNSTHHPHPHNNPNPKSNNIIETGDSPDQSTTKTSHHVPSEKQQEVDGDFCQRCNQFVTDFAIHNARHDSFDRGDPYQCLQCELGFIREASLERHWIKRHAQDIDFFSCFNAEEKINHNNNLHVTEPLQDMTPYTTNGYGVFGDKDDVGIKNKSKSGAIMTRLSKPSGEVVMGDDKNDDGEHGEEEDEQHPIATTNKGPGKIRTYKIIIEPTKGADAVVQCTRCKEQHRRNHHSDHMRLHAFYDLTGSAFMENRCVPCGMAYPSVQGLTRHLNRCGGPDPLKKQLVSRRRLALSPEMGDAYPSTTLLKPVGGIETIGENNEAEGGDDNLRVGASTTMVSSMKNARMTSRTTIASKFNTAPTSLKQLPVLNRPSAINMGQNGGWTTTTTQSTRPSRQSNLPRHSPPTTTTTTTTATTSTTGRTSASKTPAPTTTQSRYGSSRDKKLIVCDQCPALFRTSNRTNHMKLHHNFNRTGSGWVPNRCDICSVAYPSETGLMKHNMRYHSELSGEGDDENDDEGGEEQQPPQPPLPPPRRSSRVNCDDFMTPTTITTNNNNTETNLMHDVDFNTGETILGGVGIEDSGESKGGINLTALISKNSKFGGAKSGGGTW